MKADLDEIVFRCRNKNYGAYFLRKKQEEYTRKAFLWGAGAMLAMFLAPYCFSDLYGNTHEKDPVTAEPMDWGKLPENLPKEEVPELPKLETPPPPPPNISMKDFTQAQIVKDEEAPQTATIHSIDSLKNAVIGNQDRAGQDPNGDAPADVIFVQKGEDKLPDEIKPIEEPADDNRIVEYPPVMAEAVNMNELKRKLRFPPILAEGGSLGGKVIIKVLVNKEGDVSDYKVLRSPHPLFTDEVVRNLNTLKFKPARQGKHTVRTWVVLPVEFKRN